MEALKKRFRTAMRLVDPEHVGGDAALKVFALIYFAGLGDGLSLPPSELPQVMQLVSEISHGKWRPDPSWRWW